MTPQGPQRPRRDGAQDALEHARAALVNELVLASTLDVDGEDAPLTDAERAAYTEGLRRALDLLPDAPPIQAPPGANQRDSAVPDPCPECGGARIDAMGGPVCPRCS